MSARLIVMACFVMSGAFALLISVSIIMPPLFRMCRDLIRLPMAGAYCARHYEMFSFESFLAAMACLMLGAILIGLGVLITQDS